VVVPNRLMQGFAFEQADLRLDSLAHMPLNAVLEHVTAKVAKSAKTREQKP
jgi:hypothetical protein